MESLNKRLQELKVQAHLAAEKLNYQQVMDELDKLNKQIQKPDFWQDNKKAQEITKQAAELSSRVASWKQLLGEIDELEDLIAMNDSSMNSELSANLEKLEKLFEKLKKELRFSGPYDDHNVIMSIYAGAGGTDAQDWAQMLLRMYVRWAEKEKLNLSSISESAGEEAGIKSATVRISGNNHLYGKLKGEHGVHRLVRLSPFNADAKRQTSFAKVEILPAIDKPDEVTIDDKDLKIEVFRAGGHGGQSVNTTDSAVRVTHIPTGIGVAIQNERSQLQNKEMALSILRSRFAALQLEQHAESLTEIKGPNQSAEWGNQIRSYVLHPYKQVKDLRSGYESSDPQSVLDGDIDPLLDAQ